MTGTLTPFPNGAILYSSETLDLSNARVEVLQSFLNLRFQNTALTFEPTALSYFNNYDLRKFSFRDTFSYLQQTLAAGWNISDSFAAFYINRFNQSGLFIGQNIAVLSLGPSTYLSLQPSQLTLKVGNDGPILDLNINDHQTTLSNKLGHEELILGDETALKKDNNNYLIFNSDGQCEIKIQSTLKLTAQFFDINGLISDNLIGATGIRGTTGLKGPTGYQGKTGIKGNTGLKGITGLLGRTGLKGPTGVKGNQGNTGLRGRTGLKGATGPAGGPQGVTGYFGKTGIRGVKGVTGIRGNTGVRGITGPRGRTGIRGLQGGTGVRGPTGMRGFTGVLGRTGVRGRTGFRGPTGIRGVTGVRGRTGLLGRTGVQGKTGVIGKTGIQGKTGVLGRTGLKGLTGFRGPTGIRGVTGLKGVTGVISFHVNGPFEFFASGALTPQFIISGGGIYTPLKLTVDGLIDPTAVVLSTQSSNPWSVVSGYGALYVKDTDPSSLTFVNNIGKEITLGSGKYDQNLTPVSNTTIGIDTLHSYSIPGQTLAASGSSLEIDGYVTISSISDFFLALGAFNGGFNNLATGTYLLTARIIRVTSNSQIVEILLQSQTNTKILIDNAVNQNLNNTLTLAIKGHDSASSSGGTITLNRSRLTLIQ